MGFIVRESAGSSFFPSHLSSTKPIAEYGAPSSTSGPRYLVTVVAADDPISFAILKETDFFLTTGAYARLLSPFSTAFTCAGNDPSAL